MQYSVLSVIPQKKLHEAKIQTLADCEDCKKHLKLDSSCKVCMVKNEALHRYAGANIPLKYWYIKMSDFKGPPALLNSYNQITEDIKESYKKGTSLCFAGSHGIGKQLSLETELPTPNGFIKLSQLKEGDELFDENGNICQVTKLHPINISPESYRITFDDGSTIDACADHRWLTWTRKERYNFQKNLKLNDRPQVRSTKEILETLKVPGKQQITNHSIPCSKPLLYPKKNLLIDPYVLGCWLGDGSAKNGDIESADNQIIEEIKKTGYEIYVKPSSIRTDSKSCSYRIGNLVNKLKGNKIGQLKYELQQLDLLSNKHIPNEYLYSSYDQRLALVQGLMDTDGSINKFGAIEFCTVLEKLAYQVYEILLSLGIKTTVRKSASFLNGKPYKNRYRICFCTKLPVFRLKRKLEKIRLNKTQLTRTEHRFIVNIEKIKPIPMRCITVDSPSHLFLVTRACIPTHNTVTVCNILKKVVEKSYTGLYVSLNDIVSNMIHNSDENRTVARKELVQVDFLVIDEFDPRHMGSEQSANLFGRILEDIFRVRAQNVLPTFMCSNNLKPQDSFTGPLKNSIESLMNYVKIVPLVGKDFRKEGM